MPRGRRKAVENEVKIEEAKIEAVAEEKAVTEELAHQEATEATEDVREAVKESEIKKDEKDVEIENLKAQLEQLKEMIQTQNNQQPQQVYVMADNSEKVWFLWMADVSNENQILIGENGQYGRINGPVGTFYVPKNDLSRVMDAAMRHFLELRWMIVVDGLTEEEREALGVNYKEGELLDEKAFRKITTLGKELLDIFPALCDSHKEMVASRYHEDYANGRPIDRNMVVALNAIYPCEGFKDIIADMNNKDAQA